MSSCVYLSDVEGRNMSESESSALTSNLLKNTQNTLRNREAPQIHYRLTGATKYPQLTDSSKQETYAELSMK